MKFTNTKSTKLYPDDVDTLKKISAMRYQNNLDRKQLTPARLLKAALRIPKVKDVLLSANIRDEK